MKQLAAILVALCLCSIAFAQGQKFDSRVVFMDGATGSFFKVGERVYLISCGHKTASTNVAVGERLKFTTADGVTKAATVVAVDAESDCSISTFEGSLSSAVKPFTLSQKPLADRDTLWVIGFPMGRYRVRTGQFQQDGPHLFLSGGATPGESGGPIVNSDGQLVGVLIGDVTGSGQTIACGRGPIVNLCSKLPDFDPMQMACFQGGCQGGVCYPPANNVRPPRPTNPVIVNQPPAVPAVASKPCECAPKWESQSQANVKIQADLEAAQSRVSKLETTVSTQQATILAMQQNFEVKIAEYLAKHPSGATVDDVMAELNKRPPRIRIVDPQGKHTTKAVDVRHGYMTDLIIDQRYSTPAQ